MHRAKLSREGGTREIALGATPGVGGRLEEVKLHDEGVDGVHGLGLHPDPLPGVGAEQGVGGQPPRRVAEEGVQRVAGVRVLPRSRFARSSNGVLRRDRGQREFADDLIENFED